MSEPSVEETVSLLETMVDWHHLDGCEPYVLALVDDWRKSGEALKEMMACVRLGDDDQPGCDYERFTAARASARDALSIPPTSAAS